MTRSRASSPAGARIRTSRPAMQGGRVDELNAAYVGKPGKLPAKSDPRTLAITDYLDLSALPQVPRGHDWSLRKTTPWGMMDNWSLADCTCASAGHMIECWTANASKEHRVTDKDVLQAYCALSGYDPVTKKNDNGASFWDALRYWRKTGFGGHRIKAYTTVPYHNHDLLRAVVYLFGGAYAGLNLPKSIHRQEIWDVSTGKLTGDNKPGSFGGHAVNLVAYDETSITCVSYGRKKQMTWAFWDAYADELYAIITEDFLAGGKTPAGFDTAALIRDLEAVTKAPRETERQIVSL